MLIAQHFDAFGVRALTGEWSEGQSLSRYRWRSQEGSETDDFPEHDLTNHGITDVTLTTPYLVLYADAALRPRPGTLHHGRQHPHGRVHPQGLNRYAYCLNDPVHGTDPRGLRAFNWNALFVGVFFGAGIGLGL